MTPTIRYLPYTTTTEDGPEFADIMAKAVGGPYEIVMPPVEGKHSPNKSYAWLTEMVVTGKADIGLLPIIVTEALKEFGDYCYPFMMDSAAFMVPKNTHVADVSSIFKPFSFQAWIALLASSFSMSLLLCALLMKKCQFSHILNNILRSLLQQSATFKTEREKWFMFTWFLGVFFLTCCYLSLLLSFLTFPPRNEVRDIPELAEQVRNGRYEVTTTKNYMASMLLKSGDESMRIIGKSIQENPSSLESETTFVYKKNRNRAFISSTNVLNMFQDRFFVSSDNFYFTFVSFLVRKGFCCQERLTRGIHRITAAGFISKIINWDEFTNGYEIKSHKLYEDDESMSLTLLHLEGAFIILGTGLSLACFTLLIEIFVHRYEKKKLNILY